MKEQKTKAVSSESEELWEKTGGDDLLKGYENFQQYFNSLPEHEKAFEWFDGVPTYLVCIDERIPGSSVLSSAANYLHMASEGILNPHAIEDLQGKIRGFIPHKNCGAKMLYCQINNLSLDDYDQKGLEAVYKLANKMHLSVPQVIDAASLLDNHFARTIYYDGTGMFDFSKVSGLAPGFIISRKIIKDPKYAQKEVEIATKIAFSKHGFDKRFTPSTPFYLVAVSGNRLDYIPIDVLVAELKESDINTDYINIETLIK